MRARRNLGAGIASLLTDRERLGVAVAGLSVAALGIYSAREGTRVAGRAFDRRDRPIHAYTVLSAVAKRMLGRSQADACMVTGGRTLTASQSLNVLSRHSFECLYWLWASMKHLPFTLFDVEDATQRAEGAPGGWARPSWCARRRGGAGGSAAGPRSRWRT